jgi:Flp pilus assembly protein TadG
MRQKTPNQARRGAIVPLAALLGTVLIGMMAFSIDCGWVVMVQGELQNAADAAALAGAERLQGLYVQYYAPGANQQQVYDFATTDASTATSPICTAQRFAAANQAGNVSVQVRASDITFNYYDGTNPFVSAHYPDTFPNTITVTARRDNVANGPLGLFFARIFGWSSINLTATASATVYAGDVSSLQALTSAGPHIIPVALDQNIWETFYTNGTSPDGQIHLGPNGIPQLHVYPTDTNTPGSFGLLDVGAPANDAPAFRTWIDTGETPNDINYLINNNLVPVSPISPKSWKCGPGLTSTLVSDFQSQMGKPNLIPLFKPVNPTLGDDYVAASGNGQGATYAITGFVGVKISQATGNGNNMDISVQPMAIVDPTAVLSSPSPARPSQPSAYGTPLTTFISAKLTQ